MAVENYTPPVAPARRGFLALLTGAAVLPAAAVAAAPATRTTPVAEAFQELTRIHQALLHGPDIEDNDPIWDALDEAEEALASARSKTLEDIEAKLSFFRLNKDVCWNFGDDSVELGKRMLDSVAVDLREMLAGRADSPPASSAGAAT